MVRDDIALKFQERISYELRALYRRWGYAPYRVGKFEEYELYARNRSFLLSDRILSFTDTDGRLMAMKPDVTLSIVKNYAGEPIKKVCYNETVFRPDAEGFREIEQAGLECLGDVDGYTQCEVLMLACRSLAAVSGDYLLAVSHMGFVSALCEETGADEGARAELLALVGKKNGPGIARWCAEHGAASDIARDLQSAASLCAPPREAIEVMRRMARNDKMREACDELSQTLSGVMRFDARARLRIDLSLVNDLHYYNGVIFRGFVDGVPSALLSGGRYDNLMARMGRSPARAIGFAVYLNLLERFGQKHAAFDVDVLVTYDETSAPADVIAAVNAIAAQGKSVRAQRNADGVRYRERAAIEEGVCRFVEQND